MLLCLNSSYGNSEMDGNLGSRFLTQSAEQAKPRSKNSST